MRVLDRQRGVGRYPAIGVSVTQNQEIEPNGGVGISARLKILSVQAGSHHGQRRRDEPNGPQAIESEILLYRARCPTAEIAIHLS